MMRIALALLILGAPMMFLAPHAFAATGGDDTHPAPARVSTWNTLSPIVDNQSAPPSTLAGVGSPSIPPSLLYGHEGGAGH